MARDIAETDACVISRRERKVEMPFAHLRRILKLDRLRLHGPNGDQIGGWLQGHHGFEAQEIERQLPNPRGTALISILMVGLVSTGFALPAGMAVPPAGDMLVIILSGLIYVGANTLIIHSLCRAPLTAVTALRYATIIWAVMFDYLISDRLPDPIVFAGGALVIVEGIVMLLKWQRASVEKAV